MGAAAAGTGSAAGAGMPVGSLAAYVTNEDYPIQALENDEQGRVEFILEISPEGRATRCHVVATSGSRLLDLRTCQIMLVRARFEPARSASGAAVADTFSSSLTWTMPGSIPARR